MYVVTVSTVLTTSVLSRGSINVCQYNFELYHRTVRNEEIIPSWGKIMMLLSQEVVGSIYWFLVMTLLLHSFTWPLSTPIPHTIFSHCVQHLSSSSPAYTRLLWDFCSISSFWNPLSHILPGYSLPIIQDSAFSVTCSWRTSLSLQFEVGVPSCAYTITVLRILPCNIFFCLGISLPN